MSATTTSRRVAAVVILAIVGCAAHEGQQPSGNEIRMSKSQPNFEELSEDDLSALWREEGAKHVGEVNAFVKRGLDRGWEQAGDCPADARTPMARSVIAAVRRANDLGNLAGLRERFPPSQEPFIEMLDENGQDIPVVLLLPDGRIIARIGAPYATGKVVVIEGDRVRPLASDIITVGRSSNRRYFAVARNSGISVHDGWDGPNICTLAWPSGLEDSPKGFTLRPWDKLPPVENLVPFSKGDQVLLVTNAGVFVISSEATRRLMPSTEEAREHFEWLKSDYPDDELLTRT